MPSRDPNAMDTSAGRSRSFKPKTQGHAANVTADAAEVQCKEGCCFTCNKQGHISKNCPDKLKKKDKALVKARKAETEDSGAEGNGESLDEEKSILPDAYIVTTRQVVLLDLSTFSGGTKCKVLILVRSDLCYKALSTYTSQRRLA